MDKVWQFLLDYLSVLGLTLGAIFICGLTVALCELIFRKSLGNGFGHKVLIGTSIVGTPIHELGHAVMCLAFFHRINKVKLWQPQTEDGTLGYVSHSYNPKNPYQQLGNLFIGVGPIFSGLAAVLLLFRLCFPEVFSGYFGTEIGFGNLFSVCADVIKGIFTDKSVALIWRILGMTAIFSVCLHVNLSPADVKNSLKALPLYALLALIFTAVVFFIGGGARESVFAGLRIYTAAVMICFAPVILFSLIMVAASLIFLLLRKLFGK